MPTGYRVVSYDIATLTAKTLMERKPVNLTLGSSHAYPGGLFLGTSLDFTQYYLGGTDDHDVILEFEFKEGDILRGDLAPNSEVLVKEGILVSARFENDVMQQKFGHLLDPSLLSSRRESMRGEPLSESMGIRKVAVIRAMDANSKHIHPMDYVYRLDYGAFYTLAKRVIQAYEEGSPVRPGIEKTIMMAIEHAVTTAIYEGEPQVVAVAQVSTRDVYEARNPGEYFYDGQRPAKVVPLLTVDGESSVSLAERPNPFPTEPGV